VAHFAMDGEKPQEVHRVVHAPPPPPVPSWCKDKRSECPVWAESGECQVNPKYMIGTAESPGDCLASCARCDLLPKPAEATARRLLQQQDTSEA
jgi:prolyl 4-hydroxylase